MDKKLSIQLNGSRKIIGILRGYDIFLNITLTDALEVDSKGEKMNIGATVCICFIRGWMRRRVLLKTSTNNRFLFLGH